MKTEEAEKIFRSWQEYMEIADKLSKTLGPSLPESFLPYPTQALEEALNIMAEKFFNAGDKKKVETIEETKTGFLWQYEDDAVALESISKHLNLILKNPDLKKVKTEKLRETRDSWAKLRERK